MVPLITVQDCTFSGCQHSRLVPFTGHVYLGILGTFRLKASAL